MPMTDFAINEAYIFGNSLLCPLFAVHSDLKMHVDRSPTVHIWTVESGHGQIRNYLSPGMENARVRTDREGWAFSVAK